jgi:hypothetical protein
MSDPNVMQLYSVDYVQMLQAACRDKDADLDALKAATRLVVEALVLAQFGFNHTRCPLCAGWAMGPNGETDGKHTKDCPIHVALADPVLVALRRE